MVLKGVTVWPGVRVPLPEVKRYPATRLVDGPGGPWLTYGEYQQGAQSVSVPSDLYLQELARLNTSEPAAVCDFVRDHGWIDPPTWHKEGTFLMSPSAVAQSRQDYRRIDAIDRQWDVDHKGALWDIASPRQVGRALAFVRDLTTLWLAISGRLPEDEALDALGAGLINRPLLAEMGDQPWNVRAIFIQYLYVGVRPFHVGIALGGEVDPWGGIYDLFNVLCLSLVNDIADDSDFKRCRNETCGRFFTRHRGRATQGKYHMTGVKYCSVECARAQKQREYRRRQRAKGAKP